MKKIILIAIVFFGVSNAKAQWKGGETSTTNATSKGNRLEQRTDTFYIPAKEADGGEIKHIVEDKYTKKGLDSTKTKEPKTESQKTKSVAKNKSE